MSGDHVRFDKSGFVIYSPHQPQDRRDPYLRIFCKAANVELTEQETKDLSDALAQLAHEMGVERRRKAGLHT